MGRTIGLVALSLAMLSACASTSDDHEIVGWKRHFGEPNGPTNATSVAVSPEGNLILAGFTGARLDFGDDVSFPQPSNWQRAFVAGLDSQGTGLWAFTRQDPVEGYNSADRVSVDTGGNVLVVGSADFYDVTRGTIPMARGGFVSKLSPSGHPIWEARILPREPAWDLFGYGMGVVPTSSGGAVVALQCSFDSEVDDVVVEIPEPPTIVGRWLHVYALDAQGHALWGRRMTSLFSIGGRRPALAADTSGNVYFAVESQFNVDLGEGPIPFASEFAVTVASLGPAGDLGWYRSFGGSSTRVGSIAVAPDGNIVLLMTVGGDADLGGVTLGGGPYALRSVLVWLDPEGNVLRRHPFAPDTRLDALAVGPQGLILLGNHSGNDYGQTLVVQCNSDASQCMKGDLGESWKFYRAVAWHPDGDLVPAGTLEQETSNELDEYAAIGKVHFE